MNDELLGYVVPPAKIARYLLDLSSTDGSSKARFFMAFGFDPSRPDDWQKRSGGTPRRRRSSRHRRNVWGAHWNIIGPIAAPDGRTPMVLSAWIKDREAPPRLVTAVLA